MLSCHAPLVSLFFLLGTASTIVLGQTPMLDQTSQTLYRGDYAKVVELSTARLRKFPGDAAVRVFLARAEIAQGEFQKAFDNLRKALAADPRNIDALYYLSLVAKEFSRQENQRLLSLDPNSDRVHQLLGEAALSADNQSEAEREFRKALDNNPHSVAVIVDLAGLKRSQFKFDEAISLYLQAAQLEPADYDIAYSLGSCYASKEEFPSAIQWFQRAVELAPDAATPKFALGNALFRDNQFEAAIPQLKASVQKDPNLRQAYSLLGRAYWRLGRSEEAKAAIQKADELDRAEIDRKAKSGDTTPAKQR
jgi:tetratricopeptide (TPR) repeat protein